MCLDKKTLAELIKQLSPTLRVLINAAALRTMGKPLDKIIDTEPGQALKAFAEFAGRHNYHLLLLIFQQQLLAMGCNATPEEIDRAIKKYGLTGEFRLTPGLSFKTASTNVVKNVDTSARGASQNTNLFPKLYPSADMLFLNVSSSSNAEAQNTFS
ncbi:P. aerophilum family 453 [Pyrobaculum aerophilum str. IM2]|uniref:P. aerophilum family 453 n=2 Tax=Pyrobaculum aerophilum TaxID=13773 RepID=Q8ZUH6_PYRAE|nr:hypothetical protein [Pyrobaculum aerophilum]AAL64431.1 P. aerophilum family 453 [Pyrobaculum aerophilum str. IM2]HII47289.1 hypothetical protein [Pyrobaculum aerophilum]